MRRVRGPRGEIAQRVPMRMAGTSRLPVSQASRLIRAKLIVAEVPRGGPCPGDRREAAPEDTG